MSDSTSTTSPISEFPSDSDDLTADLDLGFDGAEDILRSWRKGMRPDPDLTVSEWADEHRWLSSRGAAEPGRYRTARAPYLREIMDALSPRRDPLPPTLGARAMCLWPRTVKPMSWKSVMAAPSSAR